ncbi:MAG: hypothetical protein RLZ10_866, partial [Bacteroidota bacterium]
EKKDDLFRANLYFNLYFSPNYFSIRWLFTPKKKKYGKGKLQ